MATWNLSQTKHHVLLCNGSSCNRKGGEEVTVAIREAIAEAGLDDHVHTTRTRCNGRCEDAPVMIVYPEGIWYKQITPEIAPSLVEQHFVKGEPVASLVSHRFEDGFVRVGDAPQGILKSEKGKK
ncbi:ferredoxin [Brevibacillus nitrificans]|uniref:(2Fe-2S) ferredoxin domain-containing protein n=1 Tax=Brevibacillus nitrificans TaxID=651560 RepID=A0A3M8DPD7_9BACL|nr:(2Fe-2S) ferredoxin domain-containing protein [Brevibacillus nitrificans]MDR7313848.1 (2Fe-2S) ferredoxin [Brevibacillus nitrificans]RNB88857.1 (2Fe-2S) ferredoxin domain-containing protein [Brevibacillus nitrificans]